MHTLVASSSPNSSRNSINASSSSSSHCSISGMSVFVMCLWLTSPSHCGIYQRSHRACVVPHSSVPSRQQSIYELSRWSVTIRGGDQWGTSLALASYVVSSLELYTCTKSPVWKSTGCTLLSKWAFGMLLLRVHLCVLVSVLGLQRRN